MIEMTMTLTHLGTGSRGNATLLETEQAKVLIDQGFSGAQLEKRLGRLNLHPTDIDYIFITHHHGDHGGGAAVSQKRWNMNIQANHRTAEELGLMPELTHYFEALDVIRVSEDLAILPVPVPHSGADNVAFVASHNGQDRGLPSLQTSVHGQMNLSRMYAVANTFRLRQIMTTTG